MTGLFEADPTLSATCSAADLQRFIEARDRGVKWLSQQVSDNGKPAGAELGNSWWRAPWALVVGGAPEVAAQMIGWMEREALAEDGSLRPGPYDAPPAQSPVYHLSPLAIASWLLGNYDTANRIMNAMTAFIDPESGGVFEYRSFRSDPIQDTLKTAQLGVSALVTGQSTVSDGVANWLIRNYEDQPDLPNRYFSSRRNGELVTSFDQKDAFNRVVDYSLPQQAFFHPGIAAAFLTGYHEQTGNKRAIETARNYLKITTGGGDLQFEDPTSVQICKFGWGVAHTYQTASDADLRPWVIRMGEWFLARQKQDGSWAPASFMTPEPGPLDYYWKTAEHVMELSYIITSLSSQPLDKA